MSGRFKSNSFFMERIKIVKDIKESVETSRVNLPINTRKKKTVVRVTS